MATTPEMINTFGATSTTEDVLAEINLTGKRILVTGVSAGLGVEIARSLATHGAEVVGARGIWIRRKRPQHRCERRLRPTVEASN